MEFCGQAATKPSLCFTATSVVPSSRGLARVPLNMKLDDPLDSGSSAEQAYRVFWSSSWIFSANLSSFSNFISSVWQGVEEVLGVAGSSVCEEGAGRYRERVAWFRRPLGNYLRRATAARQESLRGRTMNISCGGEGVELGSGKSCS